MEKVGRNRKVVKWVKVVEDVKTVREQTNVDETSKLLGLN